MVRTATVELVHNSHAETECLQYYTVYHVYPLG